MPEALIRLTMDFYGLTYDEVGKAKVYYNLYVVILSLLGRNEDERSTIRDYCD